MSVERKNSRRLIHSLIADTNCSKRHGWGTQQSGQLKEIWEPKSLKIFKSHHLMEYLSSFLLPHTIFLLLGVSFHFWNLRLDAINCICTSKPMRLYGCADVMVSPYQSSTFRVDMPFLCCYLLLHWAGLAIAQSEHSVLRLENQVVFVYNNVLFIRNPGVFPYIIHFSPYLFHIVY